MTQQEFYDLPETKCQIEIQKRNPYGSDAHKKAYKNIMGIAIKHGVSNEYKKSGGGDY